MTKKLKPLYFVPAAFIVSSLVLAACSGGADKSAKDDLDKYKKSDMSGYVGLSGYDKDTVFVDMDVADIKKEMDAGSSFTFFASFAECPYCNRLVSYLNDVALEEGEKVGYLNTRKDPAWESNLDIDDYDLFVELFGDSLGIDEEGKKHLYVPHVFFIKDGKLVFERQGVTESIDDPEDEITDKAVQQIKKELKDGFEKVK